MKNGTERAKEILKFAVKFRSPMQETEPVYIAPRHLQKLVDDPVAST